MKKIFLIYALSATFASCKKELLPDKPYLKVSDDVWSYIKLDPGAWYIYKDSASGVTDSVNVTFSTIHYKASKSSAGYYDDYTLTLDKVTSSGNKIPWLSGESGGRIFPTALNNYWQLTDRLTDIALMQYPSTGLNFSSPYIFYYSILPTATIEGQTYNDILVAFGSNGYAEEVWWVRGIGIVKLTRIGSSTKTYFLLRKK